MPMFSCPVLGPSLRSALISSATYLVNDVRDVESDRAPRQAQPTDRGGEVSTTTALILAAVLAVLALALAFNISPALGGLVAYAVFTGAYSLFLKNEPVIELVLLAMGFSCGRSLAAWRQGCRSPSGS